MTEETGPRKRGKLEWLALGGGALLCASGIISPAAAQTSTGAGGCVVSALSGLVPGATIVSATSVAAAAPMPAYCDVIGTLNTTGEGAPNGSAGFELRLPDNWNNKFLFFGVGGLGGSTWKLSNAFRIS